MNGWWFRPTDRGFNPGSRRAARTHGLQPDLKSAEDRVPHEGEPGRARAGVPGLLGADDLYQKSLEQPAPKGTFVLHDGPPYANGDIHMGHALNKVLKDFVVRFRRCTGYRHALRPRLGLPRPADRAQGRRRVPRGRRAPDAHELRRALPRVRGEVGRVQREQFKRLGVRGDWEHPYLTMAPDYEAKIVEVFGELVERASSTAA